MADQLVGPALGLQFRHQVQGFAHEKQRQRWFGWAAVLELNNSELGAIVGACESVNAAIDEARVWVVGLLFASTTSVEQLSWPLSWR